jgi:hypothetical protein
MPNRVAARVGKHGLPPTRLHYFHDLDRQLKTRRHDLDAFLGLEPEVAQPGTGSSPSFRGPIGDRATVA